MILVQPVVALVGRFNVPEVARWMGKGYTVTEYNSLQSAVGSSPTIVVINTVPSVGAWSSMRDQFVPKLERGLGDFHIRSPKSKVFVVLPGAGLASGFSSETLEQEVVPLIRQAAEESGVPTISLEDTPSIGEQIAEAVADFSAEKGTWRLVSADSEEADEGPAANAIDGNLATYWHTRYSPKPDPYPHQLIVDMGGPKKIAGFRYVPRQDGGTNGRVKHYRFFTSDDGVAWGAAASDGLLPNTSKATVVRFGAPVTARFFKFVALSEQNGQPYASAAEVDVIASP
jgi:hypothetical protein